MNKSKIIKIAVCLIMLIAVILLAVNVTNGGKVQCMDCDGAGVIADAACESCEGEGTIATDSRYFGTIATIAPPIIAIVLALITKEVYSSLFIGIVIAALFATQFNVVNTIDSVVNVGLISAFAGNAGIFIFLIVLGVMVALINKAGGSAAFGAWAKKNIKSKVGAEIATFVLGVLIFIDDYFNCLTVGSVMRPVTDSQKISRAKLAYLIDATAAPICMIAPVSSWAAAVAGYAAEGEGISLFIKAIPFNFYSLLTFVFIITITLLKFDYGPMTIQNRLALEGKEETVDNDTEDVPSTRGKVIDLVFPVIILIVSCVLSLLYVGGFWSGSNLVDAFGNTDATVGLPMGGLIALVVTIIYYALRKVVSFKEAMERIPAGFNAMVPAILILLFATSLKNIANDALGINYYVDATMTAAAPALKSFLPAVIFLVACVLAFATGTSWGTFGILIPIVTVMFPQGSVLLTIGMSACLAGAVCGDHCSPISDTTIMSSAGAKCNHLNHVTTQIPYAVSVAAVSFLGYVLAGFEALQNWFIIFPILVVITVAGLVIAKKVTAKNN